MTNCYCSILGIYWHHHRKVAPYEESIGHWNNSNASLSPAILLQQNTESRVAYVVLEASLFMYWTHGNVQLNMLSQSLAWLNKLYDMQMEFDDHETVHRHKFLIIKQTRCTNYEILHVSDSSSVHRQEFFHCTHSNGICQQTCMTYTIAVCTVKKLPMMDRGTVWNM